MLTLADSTALIQETTEELTASGTTLTPQAGISLIDQWLDPLTKAENTKPIADKLQEVKTLLEAQTIEEPAVQERMGELADLLSIMGSSMGAEGEIPSLLDGLTSALRQAGQTSKTDA